MENNLTHATHDEIATWTRNADVARDRARRVFCFGWQDGRAAGNFTTYRLIAARYPDWSDADIRVYFNGHDDGVRNDRWRLDRAAAGRAP